MLVQSPDQIYTVTDYDFTLNNHFVQLTIDPRFDTIEFGDKAIVANFGPKEKNGREFPSEKVVIFYTHLVTYAERSRELSEVSSEDKVDWQNFYKTVSKLNH